MSEASEMFESYVEFVYQSLLDLGNDNVVVARDVTLTGRTGIRHQIDVYYQFEKAGFSHQVAIECRNKSRAIDKDQVMAFKSKVADIPGVQGVMVARKGYQSGAKTFAEDNGILAIDITQLPSIGMLMAARVEAVALPDHKTVGEPFWALYAVEGKEAKGVFHGQVIEGRERILLFFSKAQGSRFRSKCPNLNRIGCIKVRRVS